jgi:hypothetical protein
MYVVAPATDVGVPVSAPVEVLKLIPAGVALMAKLAIAPPVETILKPVAAISTITVSDEEERVKVGAARAGVGSTTTGGGGARVVIDEDAEEETEEPAILLAVIVKV